MRTLGPLEPGNVEPLRSKEFAPFFFATFIPSWGFRIAIVSEIDDVAPVHTISSIDYAVLSCLPQSPTREKLVRESEVRS